MQSKNEFAICVYGVRCNTSYTQIANCQKAMTKNRNIDFKISKRNIDVKNIDIESKTSMFSMSMSHHYQGPQGQFCWD